VRREVPVLTFLGSGAGLTRSRHDPFVDVSAGRFARSSPSTPTGRRNGPRASCPEITMLVRQVRATIREAACAAAALLDRGARKIVLRFPAHMRMCSVANWLRTPQAGWPVGAGVPRRADFRVRAGELGIGSVWGLQGQNPARRHCWPGLNELLDDAVAAWAAGAERLARTNAPPGERSLICSGRGRRGGEPSPAARTAAADPGPAQACPPTLWLPPTAGLSPETSCSQAGRMPDGFAG